MSYKEKHASNYMTLNKNLIGGNPVFNFYVLFLCVLFSFCLTYVLCGETKFDDIKTVQIICCMTCGHILFFRREKIDHKVGQKHCFVFLVISFQLFKLLIFLISFQSFNLLRFLLLSYFHFLINC